MSLSFDGVLVVDKPDGMTSHDVVATVRRRVPRGTKVGHTGTLDPFATGVLPVVLGKATRLSQFLTASRKRYEAGVVFGAETDSGDRTGTVVATTPEAALAALTEEAISDALTRFVGTHLQVPPAHSAKKVDGERAYDLARRGVQVDLPPVEVTATAVRLERWDGASSTATVLLETSAGYYVRSFARDLGRALGVHGHLTSLRRTASGPFTIEQAHELGAVAQATQEQIRDWRLPPAAALPHLPVLRLSVAQVDAVLHGLPITPSPDQVVELPVGDEARFRLLDDDGALVALARPSAQVPGALHADIVLA